MDFLLYAIIWLACGYVARASFVAHIDAIWADCENDPEYDPYLYKLFMETRKRVRNSGFCYVLILFGVISLISSIFASDFFKNGFVWR